MATRRIGYDNSTDNVSHKLHQYSGYASGYGKNGEQFHDNSRLDGHIDVTTDMHVDIGPRGSMRSN